jgi:hypothetical protein
VRNYSVGPVGEDSVPKSRPLSATRLKIAADSFFKVLGHFENEKNKKALCNRVYLASYIDTASIFYNRVPQNVWRENMRALEPPQLALLNQYLVDVVEYRKDEFGAAEELKCRISRIMNLVKGNKVDRVSEEYYCFKAHRTLLNIPSDQMQLSDDALVYDVFIHKWRHWYGSQSGLESDEADLRWFKATFPQSVDRLKALETEFERRFDGVPWDFQAT